MTVRAEVVSSVSSLNEPSAEKSVVGLDSTVFRNVQVSLQVKLGQVSLNVEELLALKSGAVLTLDRALGEAVELLLNGTVVARGEIVAVDDHFAVRLTELGPA